MGGASSLRRATPDDVPSPYLWQLSAVWDVEYALISSWIDQRAATDLSRVGGSPATPASTGAALADEILAVFGGDTSCVNTRLLAAAREGLLEREAPSRASRRFLAIFTALATAVGLLSSPYVWLAHSPSARHLVLQLMLVFGGWLTGHVIGTPASLINRGRSDALRRAGGIVGAVTLTAITAAAQLAGVPLTTAMTIVSVVALIAALEALRIDFAERYRCKVSEMFLCQQSYAVERHKAAYADGLWSTRYLQAIQRLGVADVVIVSTKATADSGAGTMQVTVPAISAPGIGGHDGSSESRTPSSDPWGASYSLRAGEDGSRKYSVWFGTDRAPVDPLDVTRGFSSARGHKICYGICDVAIPRAHRFGSTGSNWLMRLTRLVDDRLRLRRIHVLTDRAFWASIRAALEKRGLTERDALIFLHGYNVTFEEAAIRAAQIGFDLKVPGLTAFYSWPSRGAVDDYLADEATIESSETAISEFIGMFAVASGAERVHVVAHSMGSRGLLRAMQRIVNRAATESPCRLGQVFLAAPDVDTDVFRDLARVFARGDIAKRITLYASPSDVAVGASRWLHDAPRAGLTPPVTVVPGVDTIEVPKFDILTLGHCYFADAAALLHDMFDLIRSNRPPDQRQRLDARLNVDGGRYWTLVR